VKQETAHNRSVYAAPAFGGLGLRKTAVGLRPLCGFSPAHLGRGSMLRIALLCPPKRRKQPERYAKCPQVFCKDLRNIFAKCFGGYDKWIPKELAVLTL
jgi:hypothetical protein